MQLPSARSSPIYIGAGLVLVGVVLVIAVIGRHGSTSAAPGVVAEAAAVPTAVTGPAISSDPSAPALVLGPDGTPEPFWRLKQREAREDLLSGSGGTGTVGALSIVGIRADASARSGDATGGAVQEPPAGAANTRDAPGGGQTSLSGVWAGSAQELADYLLANNSDPQFTVPVLTLAGYYVRYAAEAGLRADVLWAQMLHETGFGDYGGSVSGSQNNYAGIGATGGGVPGYTFPTAEDGVKAHIAHMAAYVYTDQRTSWTNAAVDPRYDAVNPRGVARVLSDLDGRWAVPGVGYGAAIDRHVTAMNLG